MGTTTIRRAVCLVVAMGCALLLGGCGGTTTPAPTTPAPTTPAATAPNTSPPVLPPTPAPSATASGPMTGDELVWLEAINGLLMKSQKVLGGSPCCETKAQMRALEDGMRGCTRELARLGLPSDRLQPVYKLAQKGCAQYDRAAECFATAAEIGAPVSGTSEERKFNDAIDCAFAAPNRGAILLADSVEKGSEIKNAVVEQ